MFEQVEDSLIELSGRIDTALERGDCEGFGRLIRKRAALIIGLGKCSYNGTVPPDLMELLGAEDRRWIDKAQALMGATRRKIDQLQPLKRAVSQLSKAYDHHVSSAGRFVVQSG